MRRGDKQNNDQRSRRFQAVDLHQDRKYTQRANMASTVSAIRCMMEIVRPRETQRTLKTAMVVDNDPGVLAFMTVLLEKEGMSVTTAEDGLAALSALDTTQPDLIFVDLVMPNISGDKLGKILRSQSRFAETWLIMISAISPEEEIDYRRFGFDACIAKGPFNKMGPIVLEVISQLGTTITESKPGGIYGRENLFKREITRELLSTKRHSDLIIDNLAESILETSGDGRIISANSAATRLFGVPEEKLLSSNLLDLFEGDEREEIARGIAAAAPGSSRLEITQPYRDRVITLHILAVDDEGLVSPIVIAQDVTDAHRSQEELERRVAARTEELARANEALREEIRSRKLLEEELRAMLDEIHHRVKNNLQVVSSLLNLNARRIADAGLREMVLDTRQRIQTLALVHDKLYSAGNLAALDAQPYFRSLVEGIVSSLAPDDLSITATVEAQGVTMPIEKAVPCALIVNELITNAVKHAFRNRKSGSLCVTLGMKTDRSYIVEVSDDGVGMPEGTSAEDSHTLGLRIVSVLVRQLDAELRIERSGGTSFRIHIPGALERQ
ncbi:MAG: response regulator [Spirochaetaceae bacterium]|nr:MAG: response regulator [Spirochaetaceae bacterium]